MIQRTEDGGQNPTYINPTSQEQLQSFPSLHIRPKTIPCMTTTQRTEMPGTYFVPRLLLALTVPLVLASFGPAESHPELGTDVGPLQGRKKGIEVYRADDIQAQAATRERQELSERVNLQANRKGRKVTLRVKEQ